MLMSTRSKAILSRLATLLAGAAILIVLLVFWRQGIQYRGAPDLSPLELFKVEHHHGCWFIITDDTCYTAYYYVGSGSLEGVKQRVYDHLSERSDYTVDMTDRAIYVHDADLYTDPDVEPYEYNVESMVFDVEFETASDQPREFFIPTKDCQLDSSDCVQARVIR